MQIHIKGNHGKSDFPVIEYKQGNVEDNRIGSTGIFHISKADWPQLRKLDASKDHLSEAITWSG